MSMASHDITNKRRPSTSSTRYRMCPTVFNIMSMAVNFGLRHFTIVLLFDARSVQSVQQSRCCLKNLEYTYYVVETYINKVAASVVSASLGFPNISQNKINLL